MIWNNLLSNKDLKKYSNLIPKDFDYQYYIESYQDLQLAGIDNEHKAKEHFLLFGRVEGRIYKKTNFIYNCNNHYKNEQWLINSKKILYFSPSAPDYDQSSGGNRLLQILKILKLRLKYDIYFCCNNPISSNYIRTLNKIGIKTFVSDPSTNYLNDYLIDFQNKNIQFNCAFFSWYDIANQYLETVKSLFPLTKIVVDTVDVHWLREYRLFNNNEMTKKIEIIDNFKNIEKTIYSKADVVFAITENDKNEIYKEVGNNNIKILSNIHSIYKNTKLGNDIIFIGNFSHLPNIKAAKNCIAIYLKYINTKIYKNLKKKPKLFLVGPNPTEEIIKLSKKNKNIIVTGKIRDLEDIYNRGRVLLAPLESGAGIKGKICDAAMRGLPILTSDIGNEGINLVDSLSGYIANNTKDFIKKLKHIYTLDTRSLKKISKAGKDLIYKIVSEESALQCLKHTLEPKHIVISIIAYNKPAMLENCLNSILEKTRYPNYTIVVQDNSTNHDIYNLMHLKYIKYKHIIYNKNKTNEYFIIPNNRIIEKYNNADIVLINDDIEIITECWLSYLYSSAYSSSIIAAAGGKTIYSDGTLAEAGAELYMSGYGKNKGRYNNPDDPSYNKIEYTGYCSGCLLYLKREAINKIGLFDEDFFPMYYEDSEWQYRAHTLGYKTIYDPRCLAIHNEGSSSGTDITKGAKQYQEANRKKFVKKYKNINIEQFNI